MDPLLLCSQPDAPLDARQLKRLAKRATLGLGRTASFAANGSGDIAIAFSTANRVPHYPLEPLQTYTFLHDSDASMSLLFAAAAECVEEAILNSLCSANNHYRLQQAYSFKHTRCSNKIVPSP
nr:P1 family peptidase [Shouchella lehensis]